MIQDFSFQKFGDGTLQISLTNPTPIGSWDIRFLVLKRFGSTSGLIQKYYSSGFTGSGITLVNSGQGTLNVSLRSVDTSGLEFGNYAYVAERTNSGLFNAFAKGTIILLPGGVG